MGEQEQEKKSRFKSKMFWSKVVGVIVVLGMFYGFGSSGAAVELEDGKANLEELKAEIKEKESKIKQVEGKLEKVNSKFDDRKSEFEDALAALENKESIQSEIKTLEQKLNDKQSEIDSLTQKIYVKEDNLSSLNGKIVKAKGKPIKLGAGEYIVGQDIPEGRFKAEPIGRGSNFVVYNSNGSPTVNTILGNGDFGESSYVFFTSNLDTIVTKSSVKLTPVE